MTTTTATDLPKVIQREIASFLPASNVQNYAYTCHQIYSDLNIGVLKDVHIFPDINNYENDYCWHYCGTDLSPFIFTNGLIHSVRFRCEWKDQGWGNRKGGLQIIAMPSKTTTTESPEDQKQKVVVWHNSTVAEHHATKLMVEFMPQLDKRYFLEYHVGGGGGHSLHVRDIKLDCLIYNGDAGKTTKMYEQIIPKAPGSTWQTKFIRLARGISKSILAQIDEGSVPDPMLVSTLQGALAPDENHTYLDWTDKDTLLIFEQILAGLESSEKYRDLISNPYDDGYDYSSDDGSDDGAY